MSMNMSYCRFENTHKALLECSTALYDNGEASEDVVKELSKSEQQAHKSLFELMALMLEDAGYTVEAPHDD